MYIVKFYSLNSFANCTNALLLSWLKATESTETFNLASIKFARFSSDTVSGTSSKRSSVLLITNGRTVRVSPCTTCFLSTTLCTTVKSNSSSTCICIDRDDINQEDTIFDICLHRSSRLLEIKF